jgi:hypothetical protein
MKQLYNQERILLITNYYDGSWLSLFSIILKHILGGPNHSAILKDNIVTEMQANGKIETPLDIWLNKTRRNVKVYKSKVPIVIPTDLPNNGAYGFLDLIHMGWYLLEQKLGIKSKVWNGVKGTKLWEGTVCSELCALAINRQDSHLQTPTSLQFVDELEFEFEFEFEQDN